MKITKMWHTDLVEPSVIGKNDVDRLDQCRVATNLQLVKKQYLLRLNNA